MFIASSKELKKNSIAQNVPLQIYNKIQSYTYQNLICLCFSKIDLIKNDLFIE